MKASNPQSSESIRVAILEDRQVDLDAYFFRLAQTPQIQVVGTAGYASELEPLLASQTADVVLLDARVNLAPDKPVNYPIYDYIRRLLETYPDLIIVVVSVITERSFANAVINAGAKAYIPKDDGNSFRRLGQIVSEFIHGRQEIFFSPMLEPPPAIHDVPRLTPRQLQFLSLCAAHPELTEREFAAQLFVTHSTARNTLHSLYTKLQVTNRASAISKARQLGILPPSDG